MTHTLEQLLSAYSPKSYAAMIKRRPDLLSYVDNLSVTLGTTSITETLYCFSHNCTPRMCNCGEPAIFNTYIKGYRKFCSFSCPEKGKTHSTILGEWQQSISDEIREKMILKQKATCFQKYGADSHMKSAKFRDKLQQECMKVYGVKSNLERLDVREKIKKTNIARYGVEMPLSSLEIRKKGEHTTISRYGGLMVQARAASYEKYNGKNPFEDSEVKQKIKNTLQQKFGKTSPKYFHLTDEQVKIVTTKELFTSIVSGLSLNEAAIAIGINPTTVGRIANKFNCRDMLVTPTKSKWELLIAQFLDDNNIVYIQNTRRVIPPLELDFYIPEFNFAIEVGSLYTHSEVKNPKRGNEYHNGKWKDCANKGITLVQYLDDELAKSMDIVKSKILYHCKKISSIVGARKIEIVRLHNYAAESKFLNENHIQGESKDRSYVYGGYYQNELVAIFAAKQRNPYLEITRFSAKLYTSFPGLFSKMFKFMIADLKFVGKVVSFSNNNHSNGNLYEQSGFIPEKHIDPSYSYSSDYRTRENRQKFMKSKLKKLFNIDISNKTEWEIMQEAGYDRIWDAGKIKWSKDV